MLAEKVTEGMSGLAQQTHSFSAFKTSSPLSNAIPTSYRLPPRLRTQRYHHNAYCESPPNLLTSLPKNPPFQPSIGANGMVVIPIGLAEPKPKYGGRPDYGTEVNNGVIDYVTELIYLRRKRIRGLPFPTNSVPWHTLRENRLFQARVYLFVIGVCGSHVYLNGRNVVFEYRLDELKNIIDLQGRFEISLV